MKYFTISFSISEDKLGTIVGLITREVSDLSIREQESGKKKYKRDHPFDRKIAVRKSPIWEAVQSFVTGRTKSFTRENIGEVIISAGGAASGASSYITRLKAENMAEYVSDGNYKSLV